jgi:hypothetical protein
MAQNCVISTDFFQIAKFWKKIVTCLKNMVGFQNIFTFFSNLQLNLVKSSCGQ